MLQLHLPEEFSTELKKTISDAYKDAIEQSRRDLSINVEFLTKQNTMELYDISNNTLMNWVQNGLEMYKINSKIYFKRQNINNYIEKHRI